MVNYEKYTKDKAELLFLIGYTEANLKYSARIKNVRMLLRNLEHTDGMFTLLLLWFYF